MVDELIFNIVETNKIEGNLDDGSVIDVNMTAGSQGKGIKSIAKTSTVGLIDTYTITFDDNTTITINITNGAKGDTGNGISSIAKTNTVGLVDTYTITFTSGATTTFDVTNGSPVNQAVNVTITDAGNLIAATTVEGAFQEIAIKDTVIYDTTFNATYLGGTWSADSTTDLLTCSVDHGLVVGDAVDFDNGIGALPTGITPYPEFYFVHSVPTTKTLTLKNKWGDTVALDITANGTAGWKIRKAKVTPSSATLDFSQYKEIDFYCTNFQLVGYKTSGQSLGFITLTPVGIRTMLNTGGYGNNNVISTGTMITKKYVKLPLRINVRKIDSMNYSIAVFISGLGSDNSDMSSSTTYTFIATGILTMAELTKIVPSDGIDGMVKNGTRYVIVRR